MNNEPVALSQGEILYILQNANSVPLGQPIWNSTEEYNKLKAIIECAVSYTHPVKELTDAEIEEVLIEQMPTWQSMDSMVAFAKAILRKAQEK